MTPGLVSALSMTLMSPTRHFVSAGGEDEAWNGEEFDPECSGDVELRGYIELPKSRALTLHVSIPSFLTKFTKLE